MAFCAKQMRPKLDNLVGEIGACIAFVQDSNLILIVDP